MTDRPSNQAPGSDTEPSKDPRPSISTHWLWVLVALFTAVWVWSATLDTSATPTIDYSDFVTHLDRDQVGTVTIRGQQLQGEFRQEQAVKGGRSKLFRTMLPPNDDELYQKLREKHVRTRIAAADNSVNQVLVSVLPWVLVIGVWIWFSRRAQKLFSGGDGLPGLGKQKSRKFERDAAVQVRFDDVAGLEQAKRDLQEVVQFLKEPERFQRLGGKIPRGVLLVGPPGTGKTLLARAVAGESEVPFYSISASEFIEMFVGVGAARVRDLFGEAQKHAPAIVFIDEIDAVGRSRGAGLGGGHDEREQTLNQLLSEMDGFEHEDMVVVMAATNRPDVLDSALLRPGRFDRRVMLDRPEVKARRAILAVHTKKKPVADDVDLDGWASLTPGFSGADLANLVNEAALSAVRQGREAITASDFSYAHDKIVLGDPRDAKLDEKEKLRVAIHEAGHAVVAHLSECSEPLHRVSIIPRGMALGVTQQMPTVDRHILTKPELESRLRVLLGGYAAERSVLGSPSTGAENDLKTATDLASKMVAQYGMSDRLGPTYYEHNAEHPFLGQRVATQSGASDATTYAIEREARSVLTHALQDTERLLGKHRDKLERLYRVLLERETIEAEELRELLGSPVVAEVHLISA